MPKGVGVRVSPSPPPAKSLTATSRTGTVYLLRYRPRLVLQAQAVVNGRINLKHPPRGQSARHSAQA